MFISFLTFSLFISSDILKIFNESSESKEFFESEKANYEWKLTFEDNFDSFNSTNWITHFESGRRTIWSNKEIQWYMDQNVKVENGILILTAKKEQVHGKDVENEADFNFTSGMISGSKSFLQAYGKWEMKVKFPFRKGFWPAFWLVPLQIPTLPEIDVFEYFGINKNSISSAHHWGLDYPGLQNDFYSGKNEPFFYSKGKDITGDFADKWMIWSFECFPDKMIWKLNNNIVFEEKVGIPTAPLYILANVAIKEQKENNFIVGNDEAPYEMEIDYIRVFKMIPKGN